MNGGTDSENFLHLFKGIESIDGSNISINNRYSNVFVINKDETKIKRNGNIIEKLSTNTDDLKSLFSLNCKLKIENIDNACDEIFNSLLNNKFYKDNPKNFLVIGDIISDDDIKNTHPYIAVLILKYFNFNKSKIKYNGGHIIVFLKDNLIKYENNLLNYFYQLIDLINGNPSLYNDDYREYFKDDIKDCKEIFTDLEKNNKSGLTFFVKHPKEEKKDWKDTIREKYRNDTESLIIANNYNYGRYSLSFDSIK